MRKQNFLKLLLPIGVLLVVCSLFIGHFTQISQPFIAFLRGLGVVLIVAFFLKASLTKTAW